jgi:hypothetical protein
MAAPPPADVAQVKLASLTCRTLLRHGLLPKGLHTHFVGNKGRFSVVSAATGSGPNASGQ